MYVGVYICMYDSKASFFKREFEVIYFYVFKNCIVDYSFICQIIGHLKIIETYAINMFIDSPTRRHFRHINIEMSMVYNSAFL